MAFTFNRAITIDHTKCGSSDSSAFPVLVNTQPASAGVLGSLKSVSNGGHVQSSSGFDIYFYSNAGLTTRLPAERVSYDPTTGIGEWWVQVATLSHSSDTVIYVAYGDATISTDPNSDATYGKTNVWDSSYAAVWHFSEGSGTVVHDSTANGRDMTISLHLSLFAGGNWAGAGQLGAATLNPYGDGAIGPGSGNPIHNDLENPTTTSLVGTNGFTIEAWIKVASALYANNDWTVWSQWNGTGCMLYNSGSGGYKVYVDGNNTLITSAVPNDSAWHHVVGQKLAGGTTGVFYVDGVQDTHVAAFGTFGAAGIVSNIGTYNTEFRGPCPGLLDEIRLSTFDRSADWVLSEYNNGFIPDKDASASGFYAFGSESGGAAAQVPYQTYYQGIVTQ